MKGELLLNWEKLGNWAGRTGRIMSRSWQG